MEKDSEVDEMVRHVMAEYDLSGISEAGRMKCEELYRRYAEGKMTHSSDLLKLRSLINSVRREWQILKDASDDPGFKKFMDRFDEWTWRDHEKLKEQRR